MSLTIIVDRRQNRTGVVRWFKDPSFNIAYPSGPLLEFSIDQFREKGVDLVRRHFEEFESRPMDRGGIAPVFSSEAEERQYLRGKLPVNVSRNHTTGELTLSPMRFRSFALAGLQVIAVELCRKLPAAFTANQYWEAFNAVLAELE